MELLTLYLLILYWQFIMYQLFKALKYMHSAELIHRDIKVFNKFKSLTPKLTNFSFGVSLIPQDLCTNFSVVINFQIYFP